MMLTKLAVWYLRKKKCSVLIGYNIKYGRIMSKYNDSLIYDNNLTDVDYRNCDNEKIEIPEGKFKITRRKLGDEENIDW